jgi:hypothetical protein
VLALLLGRAPLHPAVLLFVSVAAVTTVIFGSPGTDTNHLIDLQVASLVAVAVVITQRGPTPATFAGAALVVAALAGSLSLVSGLVNARAEQRRGTFAQALALIPDHARPILAQNPLVPVSAGQRPFIIDPFMVRLATERDPVLGNRLWDAIRDRRFAAVVFERDPDTTRDLYRTILGERFVDEVEQAYQPAAHVGQRVIFLPRPQ